MKTSFITLLGCALLTLSSTLVACDDQTPAPKDPSNAKGDPTKVDPSSVGANTPEPSGPADGVRPTSEAPGSPADGGHCPKGRPDSKATTLDSCLDSCKGMDDTVPPSSRCVSEKTSCAATCNAKYHP